MFHLPRHVAVNFCLLRFRFPQMTKVWKLTISTRRRAELSQDEMMLKQCWQNIVEVAIVEHCQHCGSCRNLDSSHASLPWLPIKTFSGTLFTFWLQLMFAESNQFTSCITLKIWMCSIIYFSINGIQPIHQPYLPYYISALLSFNPQIHME